MAEAFVKKFNSLGPASYVKEGEPIDSARVTNKLVPKEVSILLANFRAGDHKLIIVDLDFD